MKFELWLDGAVFLWATLYAMHGHDPWEEKGNSAVDGAVNVMRFGLASGGSRCLSLIYASGRAESISLAIA